MWRLTGWIALLCAVLFAGNAVAEDSDILRLLVLDAASHTPLSGAHVVLRYYQPPPWNESSNTEGQYLLSTGTTDRAGVVSLRIGDAPAYEFHSEESLKVTHEMFRPFESKFNWGELKHLGNDEESIGSVFQGMEIASVRESAPWNEGDVIMGVTVYLRPILNRHNRERASGEPVPVPHLRTPSGPGIRLYDEYRGGYPSMGDWIKLIYESDDPSFHYISISDESGYRDDRAWATSLMLYLYALTSDSPDPRSPAVFQLEEADGGRVQLDGWVFDLQDAYRVDAEDEWFDPERMRVIRARIVCSQGHALFSWE